MVRASIVNWMELASLRNRDALIWARPFLVVLATLVMLGSAGICEAQEYRGWGVRAGMSDDPGQFFFGGQAQVETGVEQLFFVPNVTLGFGDNLTLFALNPDLHYRIPAGDTGQLFFGGLLALQYWNWDSTYVSGSSFELGIHVLAGFQFNEDLFVELNIGLADAPDLKVAFGFLQWD